MKQIDLTRPGGMPFDQDTLGFSQTGITDTFAQLGGLLGTYIILNGTQSTGGWVSVNGKIMPFDAGSGDPCYVRETTESVIFLDGENKPIYSTFKLVFGLGTPQLSWGNFKRLSPIIELQTRLEELERKNAVFQAGGGMVLWNKPALLIPDGWQEVVDWRGRIPAGFDANQAEFNTVGKTGGQKTTTITKNNLPAVRLDYRDSYMLEYVNYGGVSGVEQLANGYQGNKGTDGSRRFLHYINRQTEPLGSGTGIAVLNPYRVVLFIEYVR